MKILITGTSSGIGKGCAEFFLKKGHEVYGFDKMPPRSLSPDIPISAWISEIRIPTRNSLL